MASQVTGTGDEARTATLALLGARRADATICPSEVARALAAARGAADWRGDMAGVHAAVDALVAAGLVRLSWKGEAMAGREGPYRIALALDIRNIAILARKCRNSVMAQMNVSIPDQLKSWAETRVAEGRYSSTSDYVRDLVRRDQDYEVKRRALLAAIDEGLASPEVDTTVDDIIARGRARHGVK